MAELEDTKGKDCALRVAGAIFLVISLLQLSRVFLRFRISLENTEIPIFVSAIAFVVALVLALWMFRSAR